MNKKIIVSVLTLLIIAGSTSFTAFASMDNGSTVIGNKAFGLDYLNDPANLSEITDAIITGEAIYVKNFNGEWIDNLTGEVVSASVIPAVVYKTAEGEINFDAADTSVPTSEPTQLKTFTSITNAITNLSNVIYFTAEDQYGKAFNILTDSSYKVTATVNGIPLNATEAVLTTENNMAKITLNKNLVENDSVVIMLEKFDRDPKLTTAKLVSQVSTAFTVGKDASIAPNSILGVTSSVDTIVAGDDAVTLSADVRDQYNNPANLTVNKLRWIVETGGNLLDTNSELSSSKAMLVKTGNKVTFKAIKPGIVTISAYNMSNGAKALYTVSVCPKTVKSIELGNDIVDNSIISNAKNPVYRAVSVTDSKGNEMIPDISKWTILTKNGANDVNDFASIVYYKHDNNGNIIDATSDDAQGIAVKFDPSAKAFSTMAVDATLIVTVGGKAIGEANIITDTLNVTVRTKSEVKSITLGDPDVSIILGTLVKKELTVYDQYGVIIDPDMVEVVYGVKTTATVSYDVVDKKMYITYNGEATGTDTIVVQAKANHKIKATSNVSIWDATNTSTTDN